MGNINFVAGGRTGDLLHNLIAVKLICEKNKTKANLFITDNGKFGGDSFSFSIQKTYNDLKDLIEYQEYIDNFNILNEENEPKEYINLNSWRYKGFLNTTNWINLISKSYNTSVIYTNWINYKKNSFYEDKILIHRSSHRRTDSFPWDSITKNNKCYFITTDRGEYESFTYKERVELLFFDSFSDFAESINSCKFFIGNMSTPLALAHSLGVNRLAELYISDQVHYIGEENFLKNYFYMGHNFVKNYVTGLEDYIKFK
jgi:hypothetical protein